MVQNFEMFEQTTPFLYFL